MSLLLRLQGLHLSFPHKTCFTGFSACVYSGERIAVIGANGAGKSILLKSIAGISRQYEGQIDTAGAVGYVPQIVEDYGTLSGGGRFNKALGVALAANPDVLILDEPTNHLDDNNRRSLMRLIRSFSGTVIAATHDAELLDTCFDTLWHIDKGKIRVVNARYSDYRLMLTKEADNVSHEISQIKQEQKAQHDKLMREQERAKKSRLSGEKKRDNRRVLPAKFNQMQSDGSKTSGSKRKELNISRQLAAERLGELYTGEISVPRFIIPYGSKGLKPVLQVVNGSVGYGKPLFSGINVTVPADGRLSVEGANGSGKSTFLKAIMGNVAVTKSGEWLLPPKNSIGFLDQHYGTLDSRLTVFETARKATTITDHELRDHLNGFMFRKNEEVFAKVSMLSGGEKARLCLAVMALNTPALLILDEVTNNIDLPTKEHISAILNEFPGAVIIVSHDRRFLEEINITDTLRIG